MAKRSDPDVAGSNPAESHQTKVGQTKYNGLGFGN